MSVILCTGESSAVYLSPSDLNARSKGLHLTCNLWGLLVQRVMIILFGKFRIKDLLSVSESGGRHTNSPSIRPASGRPSLASAPALSSIRILK